MKNILLMMALFALTFSIPLQVNAKGKPISAVQLKDANGETVGRVIGMEHVSRSYVLTEQGYRTDIPLPRGWIQVKVQSIYYESTDCTGNTAYVESPRYVGTVFVPNLLEDAAYNLGKIFYIPHNTQSVTVTTNSMYNTWDPNNPSCDPVVETGEGYPAYPNDPTITGIKNTVYPTPMVIE